MSGERGHAGLRLDRLYSPPEIGAPGKRRAQGERRDLLYAGLFVLAMAAVALAAFTVVLPGLFGQIYRLDAYFTSTRGLDAGMQVVQGGYVIGLVERVTPVFPGSDKASESCATAIADGAPRSPCFSVTLRIADAWPIPRDSRARLVSLGLLQGNAIEIIAGQETALLADGQVIVAEPPEPDLTERLAVLTDTLRLVVEESIAPTLASIREQVKTIEHLIGSGEDQGENRDRLAGAFENLQLLTENLANAVDPVAIASILASVETTTAGLARITSEMTQSTQDVQRAVSQYGELAVDIRAALNENRPTLQRSLDDTQFLLQSLASALTPILTNIEDATRNLAALSADLRGDPSLLIRRRQREEPSSWFE